MLWRKLFLRWAVLESEKERAEKILLELEKALGGEIDPEEFLAYKVFLETHDLFKTLVATIITQNTSENNSFRAWRRLTSRVRVEPEAIASLELDELAELIRPAGLQYQKARAIKKLAELIIREFGGDASRILELPLEEARRKLTSIPGIGWKTVDVVLSMYGKPTIGVDTHISRVAMRLGFTNTRSYERVRGKLMELYDPRTYHRVHLLYILLGRRYCRARNPKCNMCPVREYCKYYRDRIENPGKR